MAMSLLILLVVLCAGVGAWVLMRSQGQGKSFSAPVRQEHGTTETQVYTYSCQKSLFTRAELLFYRALQDATVNHYQILGKVRVADVLKPQTKNRSDWQRAFNKISAKHFDFLLCDPKNLKVLAAIELDDSSHRQVERVKRDDFLNQAVASAGLPLLRFPVQAIYDVKAIQQHIARTLGQPEPKSVSVPRPTPSPKPKPSPKPGPKPKPGSKS
jgi:very-short-patch-repair endonuclease